MRATIDTEQKTITLLSSFKHEEYQDFINKLPEDWAAFEFRVEDQIVPYRIIPDQSVPPFVWPPRDSTGNPVTNPWWTVTCSKF